MRLRRSLLLAFGATLLLASPLMTTASVGQDEEPASTSMAGKISFGTYTCRKQVPCDSNNALSPEQWAAEATACLRQGFGIKAQEGLFDDIAGLNEGGCITTNTDALPREGAKSILLPQCCVVKTPRGTCSIQCTLYQE